MNEIPNHFQPWSRSGCTFIVSPGVRCGTEDTETLSWLGRRCADHKPVFEAEHAARLAADGWTNTALAYCRWSA